jgi:hypothetical protein
MKTPDPWPHEATDKQSEDDVCVYSDHTGLKKFTRRVKKPTAKSTKGDE